MTDLNEYLQSLPEGQQELFAAAQMGVEADTFMRSDLGRYLLGRAKEEEQAALEALAVADPTNAGRIIQLQSDLKRARSFPLWILELITDGEEAEKQLRISESEY